MTHRYLLVISLLASTCLLACGTSQLPLPPTPRPAGVRTRYILEKQFRLAVLDFGEGQLADALPAVLLTELRSIGRFVVFEGGAIRASVNNTNPPAISEVTARRSADGYLSGTITSQGANQVCFDVRLENAINHEVLFAGATCTGYVAASGSMIPQRAPIRLLAEAISREIKPISYARVIGVDDNIVFIDKAREPGLMPGMVAYIVATGESLNNAGLHASVRDYTRIDPSEIRGASTPVVVGQLRVVAVEEKYSVGLLYEGDYALTGDTVFFK